MSNATVGWLLVLVAGTLEVLWPISMKQVYETTGGTRGVWLGVMGASLAASFGLVMLAVSPRFGLPIGTAYAVWTGLGAAGAAGVGIVLYHEPRNLSRMAFLGLVVVGIVGLKFTHREEAPGDGVNQTTKVAQTTVEAPTTTR